MREKSLNAGFQMNIFTVYWVVEAVIFCVFDTRKNKYVVVDRDQALTLAEARHRNISRRSKVDTGRNVTALNICFPLAFHLLSTYPNLTKRFYGAMDLGIEESIGVCGLHVWHTIL